SVSAAITACSAKPRACARGKPADALCHCERNEAIPLQLRTITGISAPALGLDLRVASLLAMTIWSVDWPHCRHRSREACTQSGGGEATGDQHDPRAARRPHPAIQMNRW